MTEFDLKEFRRLAEARGRKGWWGIWCVTTPPQEAPSGDSVPLVHGAAPPHEIREDSDAINKACADSEFVAYVGTHADAIIAELTALRKVADMASKATIGVQEDGVDVDCDALIYLAEELAAYRALRDSKGEKE